MIGPNTNISINPQNDPKKEIKSPKTIPEIDLLLFNYNYYY